MESVRKLYYGSRNFPYAGAGSPGRLEFAPINDARPLPKILSVTEMGKIHLKQGVHDLIISEQLTQWAVRISASEWKT